jgi:hypothetical protein
LEILFLPVDLVVVVSLLTFRGYGGFYLCLFFAFLSFVSDSIAKARCLAWTVVVVRVFNGGFGQILQLLSIVVWCQIYATPLLFSRHAPPSRVLRRRPLLPPEAWLSPVVRVRRVVCTRQRALCSLVRVTATLRSFLAMRGGAVVYGG